MNTNSINTKKSFRIALFSTCPIYGKLKFDKENKGYLKYYDENGEIEKEFDNYNALIMQTIIKQAKIIARMKKTILWSY